MAPKSYRNRIDEIELSLLILGKIADLEEWTGTAGYSQKKSAISRRRICYVIGESNRDRSGKIIQQKRIACLITAEIDAQVIDARFMKRQSSAHGQRLGAHRVSFDLIYRGASRGRDGR